MSKLNYNKFKWSTVSSKPKKFAGVNKEPLTYTYQLSVFLQTEPHPIDTIMVKIKLFLKNKNVDFREIDVDMNYFNRYLKEQYNIETIGVNKAQFMRDNALFPFVSTITVADKEIYFKNKKIKSRSDKLSKLFSDDE